MPEDIIPRRARNFQDLTGQIFHSLTVLRFDSSRHGRLFWECQCACGTLRIVDGKSLKRKDSRAAKSCGCQRQTTATHQMSFTSTYRVWSSMVDRCTRSNNRQYKNYGGRGITVCDKWRTFEGFFDDMGKKPIGLTLDRLNNDLGYFKDNCAWRDAHDQTRNKRSNRWLTYNNQTFCMSDWAKMKGIPVPTLYYRLMRNWPVPAALETPPDWGNNRLKLSVKSQ